jgi:hypothetical protein
MSMDVHDALRRLESGAAHAFRDRPATHFEAGPSGVYTIWNGDTFLYVGMAWKHRDDDNPRASGVFGRLKSHADGRRSGNQFAIYICDRFVVPQLTADEMAALARGERLLDAATRQYIRERLTYRVVVTDYAATARELEVRIRREGLRQTGTSVPSTELEPQGLSQMFTCSACPTTRRRFTCRDGIRTPTYPLQRGLRHLGHVRPSARKGRQAIERTP